MLVKNLLEALDRRFPLDAAAAWDPVGLQFGRGDRSVGRVGVCHEVTEAVVATAVADRVSTLVSYHPLLFDQPGPLVGGPTPEGRALSLIENRITIHAVFKQVYLFERSLIVHIRE